MIEKPNLRGDILTGSNVQKFHALPVSRVKALFGHFVDYFPLLKHNHVIFPVKQTSLSLVTLVWAHSWSPPWPWQLAISTFSLAAGKGFATMAQLSSLLSSNSREKEKNWAAAMKL